MLHPLRRSCENVEAETIPRSSRQIPPQRKCYSGFRKVQSKAAILILFQSFLVYSAFFILLWTTIEIHYGDNEATTLLYAPEALVLLLLSFLCPVAGWLADVYFGRHKVMRSGLWIMWSGFLIGTALLLSIPQFDEKAQHILWFTAGVVAFLLIPTGFAAFIVNVLQFGTDQMPQASSEELSAFIHWSMWAMFAAELTARWAHLINYCIPQVDNFTDGVRYNSGAVQLMISVTMLSIALCCDYLLQEWLIIEPESRNPLKTIAKVLKFAATHKRPIRRYSITYTTDERPSRIDFAKDRFGGPYTTEQVEDVKTCFRVTAVIVSTAAFFIPFALYIISTSHLHDKFTHRSCSLVRMDAACSLSMFAVILIPLYEFLLYPMMRRYIPSMLLRVGIAAVLTVILSVIILTADTIKHQLDPDIVCMFSTSSIDMTFNLNWCLIVISNFLVAVDMVLYIIAMLEFTYAQSPYSMRGLLIGLVYSVIFTMVPITYVIFLAWSYLKSAPPPSCDFYYYLFQLLCAVVGLIVLGVVARWYKRRRRQEEDDQRMIVEIIYERLLQYQQ